jgi:hypothetical protein
MSKIDELSASARANLQGMLQGGFPASSLRDIYRELKSTDEHGDLEVLSYRALFDEIEKLGNVGHDDSILSPAAYFADLMRLIASKESKELPAARKLFTRRPDLLEIPMDAKHTNEQVPYLELTNEMLQRKLREVDPELADPMQQLATMQKVPVLYNEAHETIKQCLAQFNLSLADIFRLNPSRTEGLPAAELGISYDEWRQLSSVDDHKNTLTPLLTSTLLNTALNAGALRQLLNKLGVDNDVIDLARGVETFSVPLRSMITVGALPEGASSMIETELAKAVQFYFYEPQGQFVLMIDTSDLSKEHLGSDVTTVKDFWHGEPLAAEGLAQYQGAISELVRFSRVVHALGWSPAELIHLINATIPTRLDSNAVQIDSKTLTKFVWLKRMQSRFDLTLSDLEWVFAFGNHFEVLGLNGEMSQFEQMFPGFPDREEHKKDRDVDAAPSWLCTGTGLSQAEIRLIYYRHFGRSVAGDLTGSALKTAVNAKFNEPFFQSIFAVPYRYRRVAELLKCSIADLCNLLDRLDLDFDQQEHLAEIIDYHDWIKTTGLSVTQICDMSQTDGTADFALADLIAANAAVQTARSVASGKTDKVVDDVIPNANTRLVVSALGEQTGLDYDLMSFLCLGTMTFKQLDQLAEQFTTGAYDMLTDSSSLDCVKGLQAFSDLQKGIKVAKAFNITAGTLFFCKTEQVFGTKCSEPNQWRAIRNLRQFHKLKEFNIEIKSEFFIELLLFATELKNAITTQTETSEEFLGRRLSHISRLCGLPAYEIATLPMIIMQDGFPLVEAAGDESYLDLYIRLRAIAKLETRLGTGFASLKSVTDLDAKWQQYQSTSTDLMCGAQSRFEPEAWLRAKDEIMAKTLEKSRDALAQSLIWVLDLVKSDSNWLPFGAVKTFTGISDILLVDIEMGGTAKISPIKLALNSLQRYIQRVQTNQESGPRPFTLDKNQWTWRAHYRLWEANRKVFLYPENFLDPGLRRIKTPLFKNVEEALMQGEINDENATNAFMAYFDKLEELAALEVISGCAATVMYPGGTTGRKTMFFIGKTDNGPAEFYVRSALFDDNNKLSVWRPWEKITLPIHVDHLASAYVNNRLHVFWLEHKDIPQPCAAGQPADTKTFVTVKFSHQTMSGTWLTPQTLHTPTTDFEKAPLTAKEFAGREINIKFPTDGPKQAVLCATAPVSITTPEGEKLRSKIHSVQDLMIVPSGQKEPLGTTPNQRETLGPTWATGYYYRDVAWEKQSRSVAGNSLTSVHDIVLCADGLTLLAAGETYDFDNKHVNRVMRSTDHGFRWDICEVGLPPEHIFHCAQPRIYLAPGCGSAFLFAGNSSPPSLYRSDDHGNSWTKLTNSHREWYRVNMFDVSFDGQTLVASIYPNTSNVPYLLYISTDSGATWQCCEVFKSRGEDVISVCFDNEFRTIIAGFEDGHTEYSTDFGTTWTKSTTNFLMTKPIKVIASFSDTPKMNALTYAACGQELFISPNGGATWNATQCRTNSDIFRIINTPSGVIVLTDDGCPKRENADGGWDDMFVNKSGDSCLVGESPTWDMTDRIQTFCMSGDLGGTLLLGAEKGLARQVKLRAFQIKSGSLTHCVQGGPSEPVVSEIYDLRTSAVGELSRKLIAHGLEDMLSLKTQTQSIETFGGTSKVPIDFGTVAAFGQYYREVFFHIPFLIADTLNKNKKFEEAQKWYHCIFRPELLGEHEEDDHDLPFWRYKPFRSYELEHLKQFGAEEFVIYEEDPFDAHAIAGIRMGAYEKAVVMRYIDNLLDWGDQLFEEDNWESLTLAMSHYTLAYDLLGPDPKAQNTANLTPRKFSEFFVEGLHESNPSDTFHMSDQTVFPIPRNTGFDDYWVRTHDRIRKIRASENIQGIKRQLALFQPPIDPRKLMQALASGLDLDQAVASLKDDLPLHRFDTMLRRAKDVTRNVSSLGSALLSALEKKDAEGLANIRTTHERHVLEMTTQMKQLIVDEANNHKKSIEVAGRAAKARKAHLELLKEKDLIGPEDTALTLKNDAKILQGTTAAIRLLASPAHLSPKIFGMSNGGMNFGGAVEAGAGAIDSTVATILNSAGLAENRGQNDRRREEWDWQSKQAQVEIDRLAQDAQNYQLVIDRAAADLALHQAAIAQNDEMRSYVANKFTNQELYGWMVGQLSSIYFQSFSLALQFARDAQAAYHFECACNDNLITQSPVNSLRGGLLAGEQLMLSLTRLERKYLDAEAAAVASELEIEKTVSLAAVCQDDKLSEVCEDWKTIRDTGILTFDFTEKFFESDGLGEYLRRIKSIALTLPAIVGPYQNLNARLQQLEYSVKTSTEMDTRTSNRQVAISRGVNDHGVFELDFHSDRYQPFEGTGVISKWCLSIPVKGQEDILNSLSDIIVHIRYTARRV